MQKPRPPIITILGHVDHGKTSLLDYIRRSRIALKEHGGITQRIGAYEIDTGIKGYPTSKITFIDTPGHEAFSKLRSRGATVADIAILVIDAKDSLMPQTVESIKHIQNAGMRFIVALNKMDLEDVRPEKVKNDLLKYEVIVEDKGGTVPVIPISAKTGMGVDELLEALLLISADMNLTFSPKAPPEAYIIETKKDRRGIVASLVPKNGTLSVGDTIFSVDQKAKIRSMTNDLGKSVKQIEPCTPVELLGFSEMPEVGTFISEEETIREKEEEKHHQASALDVLRASLAKNDETTKKLSVIVKADSQGSLEAIIDSLKDVDTITIANQGIGDVNKSDIFLAKATQSLVIGFSVGIAPEAKTIAKQEKILIKTYSIIYELLEEVQEVSELLMERDRAKITLKGEAKILATFVIENETVFGVKVTKGKINLGDMLELHRNGEKVSEIKLVSLKQRAKPIQEIKKDMEAGMLFYPIVDIRIGDVVQSVRTI